jgi:hypothetical protein
MFGGGTLHVSYVLDVLCVPIRLHLLSDVKNNTNFITYLIIKLVIHHEIIIHTSVYYIVEVILITLFDMLVYKYFIVKMVLATY